MHFLYSAFLYPAEGNECPGFPVIIRGMVPVEMHADFERFNFFERLHGRLGETNSFVDGIHGTEHTSQA